MNVRYFVCRTLAIAFGAWAFCANAQLPTHPRVQVLRPTYADTHSTTIVPIYSNFGNSIAVYKNMALVGMPSVSIGSVRSAGRVAVFTRRDGVWERTGTFMPPSPQWDGGFGRFVALENDGAIVADGIRMYVYKYDSSTGWKIVQWVKRPNSDPAGPLPYRMDFRCNTVAATVNINSQGVVYLYDRLADGTLSFKARLTSPVPTEPGHAEAFGTALAVDCNLLVVGATVYDVSGYSDRGSGYVYRRINGAWRYVQQLMPVDGNVGDEFGSAVAINRQTIFIGAPSDLLKSGDPTPDRFGSVYVFSPTSGGWAQSDKLHPNAQDYATYYAFGQSLRATDDRVFVRAQAPEPLADYLFFTYARSGGVAQSVSVVRDGIAAGTDFFATGSQLFVGVTGRPDVCQDPCMGEVHIYDVTKTN
jgi:hypothetical protein